MTINVANTGLTNTFDYWRSRTNELAYAMSQYVVTTNSNTATGNAAITGTFTANVIIANSISIGGGNGSINTSVIVTSNITSNNLLSNIATITTGNIVTLSSNSANIINIVANSVISNSIQSYSILSNSITVGNSTVNVTINAANSTLQSNGQYYLNANGQWSLVQQSVNVASRIYQSYTASAGQNTFTYGSGFNSSLVDIFYNGVHLSRSDYTVINSTSFQLYNNATNGAIVELTGFSNVNLSTFSFTATGSDTQIMFNDSGYANGATTFTFNKNTSTLYVSNTVSIGNNLNQAISTSTFGYAQVVLDSIQLSQHRCSEYIVSMKDNSSNNYQVSKIIMMHNGSNVYITEYGTLTSNTTMGTFDSSINATSASLLFTPVSSTTTIKIHKIAVTV